jgi:glutamate-1-semialdehyde aminotransferase
LHKKEREVVSNLVLQTLCKNEIDKLHKKTLEVFENIGFKVTHDETLKRLKKAGAKVDNNEIVKKTGHGCDFAVSFDYENDSGKILTLYMQEMVARGIYVSGVVYTCFTHTDKDVDCILTAADETFSIIKKALDANDVDTMLKCPVRQVGFKRLV